MENNNVDGNENGNRIGSDNYKPLPLTDFRKYSELVSLLYRTSGALILGNSLEWLDFSLYGYSESEISSQLFGGNQTVGWFTFGLGFAFRPIGAYVLGRLSDEKSRNKSFIVAMMSMATSTALMAIIPAVCNMPSVTIETYCFSSIWASAVPAVALRCVQGFSAGAAAGGVNTIQSELWSTEERKGCIAQAVGVQNVSGATASMVAAAIVYGLRALIGDIKYAAWGWRIAFLFVVPPSLVASYLMNRTIPESNDYAKRDSVIRFIEEDTEEMTSRSQRNVIQDETFDNDNEEAPIIADEPTNVTPLWILLTVLTFSEFAITAFNNLNVYLLDFVKVTYGVSANKATSMAIVGKAIQVIMTPFAAILADIKGWYWTCAFGGTLCTILALPMMVAGQFGGVAVAWILVAAFLPIVSTFWISNAPLLATCLFPAEHRSRGTSLVLSIAAAFGGFFPLLLNVIRSTYAKGAVLAVVAGFGTVGIFWIKNIAKKGKVMIYQRPELY